MKGGSYVLQELDGSIWRQGVAAFRLHPYVPRSDPRLADLAEDLDRVNLPPESKPADLSDQTNDTD